MKFSQNPISPYPILSDIDKQLSELPLKKIIQYHDEIHNFSLEFSNNNNCNIFNTCDEHDEYWNGVNMIREKYGLSKIEPFKCKCDEKEKNND